MIELIFFILLLPIIWRIFFPDNFKSQKNFLQSFLKTQASAENAIHLTGQTSPDYVARPLMSEPEIICFGILNSIKRPQDLVFSQVSMGAILDLGLSVKYKLRQASQNEVNIARSPFSSKIVDFVIYDTDLKKVVFVVELDDSSHLYKLEKDVNRDLMLKTAGYAVARIPFNSSRELTSEYISMKLSSGGYHGSKK